MVKIFRKIRQNLLSEGNTGKYLKYAIGEIMLVVIGILIALQVNTWNQKRITNETVNNSLARLVNDLKADIKLFKKGSNYYQTLNIELDSVYNLFINLDKGEDFIISPWSFHQPGLSSSNNQTYNEMLYTGNFFKILNHDLVRDISIYYKYCDDFKVQFQIANEKVDESRDNPILQPLWTLKRRLANNKSNFKLNYDWLYDINSNVYIALLSFIEDTNNANEYKKDVLDRAVLKSQELLKLIELEIKR
jgi:hypothetical protein